MYMVKQEDDKMKILNQDINDDKWSELVIKQIRVVLGIIKPKNKESIDE